MWHHEHNVAFYPEPSLPASRKAALDPGTAPVIPVECEEPLSINRSLTCHALGLAVGSLILAGCFALLLVIGRLPVISEWISDPQFFKRCLVVHVDLSLVVWFFAFIAALFALMPGDKRSHRIFGAGLTLAFIGTAGMVAGMLVPGSTPILANYVPVIDHWLFVAGVALFFAGLLICFLDGRLFVSAADPAVMEIDGRPGTKEGFRITPDVAAGLKTAALAYVVAMTTFAISWRATPRWLEAKVYYESVFWGGGHILQVANVAAMLAVWLLLLSSLLKRPLLNGRTGLDAVRTSAPSAPPLSLAHA